MAPKDSDAETRKLRHQIGDWIFAKPERIVVAAVVLCTLLLVFQKPLFKLASKITPISMEQNDTVELSDEDRQLLHDVAIKTDETAKVVASLVRAHEDLDKDFRQFIILQASSGRRLSDARIHR